MRAARERLRRQHAARRRQRSLIVKLIYNSASGADREQLASMIAEARALANPVERRTQARNPRCCVTRSSISTARSDWRWKTIARRQRICWQRSLGLHPSRHGTSAKQVTNAAERFAYLDAVAGAWAAQDPERAFAEVAELPAAVATQGAAAVGHPRNCDRAIRVSRSGLQRARGRWSRASSPS